MEYFNKVLDKVSQMYGYGSFEKTFFEGYSTLKKILDVTVEIPIKGIWNVLDSECNLVCLADQYTVDTLKSKLKDCQFVYAKRVLFNAKEEQVCTCCGSLDIMEPTEYTDLYFCKDCEFLMYKPTQLKNYNYNTKQVKI